MGKLADRIFFGVHGPRGLGLGCHSLLLAFRSVWENLQIEYILVSMAYGGCIWGAVLLFRSLYRKITKYNIFLVSRAHGS